MCYKAFISFNLLYTDVSRQEMIQQKIGIANKCEK